MVDTDVLLSIVAALFRFTPQASWAGQLLIFSTTLCYKLIKTMDYLHQVAQNVAKAIRFFTI